MRWWFIVGMIAIGAGQGSYGAWSAWSDTRAAPLFRASPSCATRWIDPAQDGGRGAAPTPDACRVESAMVVSTSSTSGRQTTTYWVRTVTADGRHDDTPLYYRGAYQFWKRLSPTSRSACSGSWPRATI